MGTAAIVIIIAGVIGVAVVVLFGLKSHRSQHLRERFGPEYEREVRETGSARQAEKHLEAREARVKKFDIRPLSSEQKSLFIESWTRVQAKFVDGPEAAVTEADHLLAEVMSARGYPVADFETAAADLSVDHPQVVKNYRAGHAIAIRHASGQAGTEDLRQALIHYRALFEELVGTSATVRAARA